MRTKSRRAMEILETIGEAALGTAEILLTIMTSPYGSSYSQLDRRLGSIRRAREEIISELKEKQNLYNLITRLNKDGLITKKEKSDKKIWKLTKKGNEELEKLEIYYQKSALPQRKYKAETIEELIIIIFDIPEKERRKRAWLRRKLIELEFTALQKSVWIGKKKIPKEFLSDLDHCKLLPYIEIFTVSKSGSLKKLTSA